MAGTGQTCKAIGQVTLGLEDVVTPCIGSFSIHGNFILMLLPVLQSLLLRDALLARAVDVH